MLLVFISFDILSYLVGQYTGLKYCQQTQLGLAEAVGSNNDDTSPTINETQSYYSTNQTIIQPLLKCRHYLQSFEYTLMLSLGKVATLLVDFIVIYIIQWANAPSAPRRTPAPATLN